MSSRFATLRTGPKLAKRLAQVELGSLPDEAVLDYLHAEIRQLSQQQARVWAAIGEVHRRVAGAYAHDAEWTPERVFDGAAYEIASELRVSKPYAVHELQRAQDLEAMPTVARALRSGEIDRNRALVLLDVCTGLSPEHRDGILAEVLPTAGKVPPAKLRAEAQRLAIALDPEWAERRYHEAVRHQRVVRYINQDGTVTIAAEDQDAVEALAAYARLTAVAKAAQRAGAHASLDTLRSKISMGLLGPRFAGRHETDIIAYLVSEYPKPVSEDPAVADRPAEHTSDEHSVDVRPADEVSVDERPCDEQSPDDESLDAESLDAESLDAESLDAESLDEAFFEAEFLAQELLDQGFFDEECTGGQRAELISIAIGMRRARSARPRTDHGPDPPPF